MKRKGGERYGDTVNIVVSADDFSHGDSGSDIPKEEDDNRGTGRCSRRTAAPPPAAIGCAARQRRLSTAHMPK